MLYKQYGKTGKKVSVIGFGGMRFAKDGKEFDYDKCADMVRKANELGINYFDTAPYYLGDNSEPIFGQAFKKMPREFYVSTKSCETDGSKLRGELERSLKRFNVPKINFFNIWAVMTMEDYRKRMIKGGAYEAALRAKEEGLIEHIVISTHCDGDEIETIIKEGCFEGITLGYNILNFPFRQKGLKAAYESGMGVVTMNPLGGGIIPKNSDYFSFLKDENDESVVEAAIRFNGSHKEISVVLCGMGTMEDVIENAKVGDKIKEFSEDKLTEIQKGLFTSMNELCSGCRYCEHCPKKIEVSKFMIGYNMKILSNANGGRDFMGDHWELPIEKANDCIECGVCEAKCTQHLPIIKRLKEMLEW